MNKRWPFLIILILIIADVMALSLPLKKNDPYVSGNFEAIDGQMVFKIVGKLEEGLVDEVDKVSNAKVLQARQTVLELPRESRAQENESTGSNLDTAMAEAEYALVKAELRKGKYEQARVPANKAMGKLNQPKPQLSYTEHWTPMEGVIPGKSAELGEYLNPPNSVVTLGDLQHPWPRPFVTEKDRSRTKLKGKVMAAKPAGYGISFGYGEADPNIKIYRVGLKKNFSSQWLKTSAGHLSGYFELSFNHWEHNNNDINSVSFSPVFAYYFGDQSNLIRPYVEGGIGVAYIDEYHIANRNLSTNFQFEDRIGIGARIRFFDLNFRYMHYSNASIKDPNDGIDNFMFTTAIQF